MNIITPIPIMIPSGGGNFDGNILDFVLIIIISIQLIYWVIITIEFMVFDELSSKGFLFRLIPLAWLVVFYSALSEKIKERW